MALKIAENFEESAALGRIIAAEKPKLYSESMLKKMMGSIQLHIPDTPEDVKQKYLYAAIYDWNAYGATVNEMFAYKFYEKTHQEKYEYLVCCDRTLYADHLCGGRNQKTYDQLENKWLLYLRLKPYFKREMIHIASKEDFAAYEDFIRRNPTYVVKPMVSSSGIGVHLDSIAHYFSPATAFQALWEEGDSFKRLHPSKTAELILEEVIVQEETMSALHPQSVNALRITTVRAANGEMVMYRPRIKIGVNGGFLASAAQNGIIAEIDPETGIIRTDGYDENGGHYLVHPNSGIKIKGFQIPKWDELLQLVDNLNHEMSEFGYIGWDLVLSKSGWCVMEGNYSGEVASQVILGKGLRQEFEELIGWKPEVKYWERYE